MKKSYLFVVLQFVVISTFFTSCSSDEHQVSELNQSEVMKFEDSELIINLMNINDDLLANKAETRKWPPKQWLNVACADIGGAWQGGKGGAVIGAKVGTLLGNPITGAAFGAFLGGAICGAGASWLASPDPYTVTEQNFSYDALQQIFTKVVDENLAVDESSIIVSPIALKKLELEDEILSTINLNQESLNVGKIHNLILSALDGSVTVDESNAVGTRSALSDTNNTLYSAVMKADEMEELFDEMTVDIANDITFSVDTKADYVMKLFEVLFIRYSEENKDVVYIINQYSNVIRASSELTNDEKNWIMTGLATALYSFNYWNVAFEN